MNWEAISAVAETLGVIGVLVSLIYLSLQIRLNTRQIADGLESNRLSAFERNVESGNRLREMLILNPDVLRLFLEGNSNFNTLEKAEQARYGMLMRNIFSALQGSYIRQQTLSHDPEDAVSTAKFVDEIIANPGVRQFLAKVEPDWRPEFREFVNERLSRFKDEN